MKLTAAACRRWGKLLSCALVVLLVLGFVGYAALQENEIRFHHSKDETPPSSSDEPKLSVAPDPTVPYDLTDWGEYPLALGIYDLLFTEEETVIPSGELKIISTDLSKNPLPGTVFLKNNTEYALDSADFLTATEGYLPASGSPLGDSDEPLVLIYHTHGTEAYAEEGRTSYEASDLPRSEDVENNVVAVGKVLAEALNAAGIPTLHCEVMHDADGEYNNSYNHSAKTVKEYLAEYPSIKYAFDIHRDALVGDTTVYKTLTYDESTPVAQIMLVVGTDNAGAIHPDWRENLSFAVNAQYYLTQRLNHLVRPISVKKSSYNQQHADIGLLIEVGTCVNTLAEAKASAEILGDILAGMIRADLTADIELT